MKDKIMIDNERKARQVANTLWTELNLVADRINATGGPRWPVYHKQIRRTLDLAQDALNEARARAGNLEKI